MVDFGSDIFVRFDTQPMLPVFTHIHEDYEIQYNVCGSYSYHYTTRDGREVSFIIDKPKTLLFTPIGTPHGAYVLSVPYHRYFIHIPPRALAHIFGGTPMMPLFHLEEGTKEEDTAFRAPRFLDVSAISERVEAYLSGMFQAQFASGTDRTCTQLDIRCMLGRLFCDLYRNCQGFFSEELSGGAANPTILAVKAYIDEHFAQTISIEELARRHNIHPSHLSRCFRQQYARSPRQYLTEVRMDNSRRLLASQRLSVHEVAARVGFNNVNNYIQSFKRMYGVTPKQYRKSELGKLAALLK